MSMNTRSSQYGSRRRGVTNATLVCDSKGETCDLVKGERLQTHTGSRGVEQEAVTEEMLTHLRQMMNQGKVAIYDQEDSTDALVCKTDAKGEMDSSSCKKVPKRTARAIKAEVDKAKRDQEIESESNAVQSQISARMAKASEYCMAVHLDSISNTQVRLVTRDVGRRMFRTPHTFDFDSLDVRVRFPKTGVPQTKEAREKWDLDAYVQYAMAQVREWESSDEKQMLEWVQMINAKLRKGYMKLSMFAPTINIIKTTGEQEPISKGESGGRLRGYLLNNTTIVLCWDCIKNEGERAAELLLTLMSQMMVGQSKELRKHMVRHLGLDSMPSADYDRICKDFDIAQREMHIPSDWPVDTDDMIPLMTAEQVGIDMSKTSVSKVWQAGPNRLMVVTLAARMVSGFPLSDIVEYVETVDGVQTRTKTYEVDPTHTIFPYRFIVPVAKKEDDHWYLIKTEDSAPMSLPYDKLSQLPQNRIAKALFDAVNNSDDGKSLDEKSDAKMLRSLLVSNMSRPVAPGKPVPEAPKPEGRQWKRTTVVVSGPGKSKHPVVGK